MRHLPKFNQDIYNTYTPCGPCKFTHADTRGTKASSAVFKNYNKWIQTLSNIFSEACLCIQHFFNNKAIQNDSCLLCRLLFMQHKTITGTRKAIWHSSKNSRKRLLLLGKHAIVSKLIWVFISGRLSLSVQVRAHRRISMTLHSSETFSALSS